MARAIHAWSADAGGVVEVVSCAAVPEPLQSRELLGCAPGTYPALPDTFQGALERALGGTLILEEYDALGTTARSALARALQQRSYRPEGDSQTKPLRVRIVATAQRDPGPTPFGVAHKEIALAPLADRMEDILPLAAHFLAQFADERGLKGVGFTAEARSALLGEPWTGNVSELRERIRQALALSEEGAISAEALVLAAEPEAVPSFREAKRAFEARYVRALLRRCDGNISQAARLARKDRKDFYDVIRRTGVDPAQFRR